MLFAQCKFFFFTGKNVMAYHDEMTFLFIANNCPLNRKVVIGCPSQTDPPTELKWWFLSTSLAVA